MHEPRDVDELAREMASDNFSDGRLTKRLETIVRGVARDPAASLPRVMDAAELEGAYRFFSNPLVKPEQIIAPHFEATRERGAVEQRVRIVHDVTEFTYRSRGRRVGLDDGRLQQGFCAHVSLVISADEIRRPIGLCGVHTWVRGKNTEPEQSFWRKQIDASERTLACGTKAIHICDRGAEDYALFHGLCEDDRRFVIRTDGRRLTKNGPNDKSMLLRDVLATIEHVAERSTTISRRGDQGNAARNKRHPPRAGRTATLNVSAARVALLRPSNCKKDLSNTLGLNVVRVWEPNPPTGIEPIEWLLFTNEPIDTAEEVCSIVDHYRARWRIEEYFKALKTGCAFEQRQLEDYESLVNLLATLAPLAFHILFLRSVAQHQPDAPGLSVVSAGQLHVLRKAGRRDLPPSPNARDVMLAIAALGGHIKYAPDPGWLTIARGYEALEKLTAGWLLARAELENGPSAREREKFPSGSDQ